MSIDPFDANNCFTKGVKTSEKVILKYSSTIFAESIKRNASQVETHSLRGVEIFISQMEHLPVFEKTVVF